LAEKPRFANENLGWMEVGEDLGLEAGGRIYKFAGWRYKPDSILCQKMFKSGDYYWNPGYFLTSIDFLLNKYQDLAPQIYKSVKTGKYEQAEAVHFDRAIIEKINPDQALVIKTNMGWSDPGTLYALKEALSKYENDNVFSGLVRAIETKDSLIYNLEEDKLVAAIGLEGMVIVNTKDAAFIAPKQEVIKLTNLIKQLKEEGGLEKYL
jgi:mannose-1-phosphate guanylyltransferase